MKREPLVRARLQVPALKNSYFLTPGKREDCELVNKGWRVRSAAQPLHVVETSAPALSTGDCSVRYKSESNRVGAQKQFMRTYSGLLDMVQSTLSHGRSRSSLPKCPYAAVG